MKHIVMPKVVETRTVGNRTTYFMAKKECAICLGVHHLSKCGRCLSVWYCSVEHQKQDWPEHKKTCGQSKIEEAEVAAKNPPTKCMGPPGTKCGLCGSSRKPLTKTPCCNNWICDDEDEYEIFSYSRSSCYRNHDRYTICSYHHSNQHQGDWTKCLVCMNEFDAENFGEMATNEYNFKKIPKEKLPNVTPTLCSICGKRVYIGKGGHTMIFTKEGVQYKHQGCG